MIGPLILFAYWLLSWSIKTCIGPRIAFARFPNCGARSRHFVQGLRAPSPQGDGKGKGGGRLQFCLVGYHPRTIIIFRHSSRRHSMFYPRDQTIKNYRFPVLEVQHVWNRASLSVGHPSLRLIPQTDECQSLSDEATSSCKARETWAPLLHSSTGARRDLDSWIFGRAEMHTPMKAQLHCSALC